LGRYEDELVPEVQVAIFLPIPVAEVARKEDQFEDEE